MHVHIPALPHSRVTHLRRRPDSVYAAVTPRRAGHATYRRQDLVPDVLITVLAGGVLAVCGSVVLVAFAHVFLG